MQRRSIGADAAERLAQIPLFEGVSLGQLRMLGRLVDELDATAGETLIDQGEHGYEFVLIEEGEAEVLQNGLRIRMIGPGEFFGELAILDDGTPRRASIVAASDLRGLVFTAHFLREIHDRVPLVGGRLDREAQARLARDARAAGPPGRQPP